MNTRAFVVAAVSTLMWPAAAIAAPQIHIAPSGPVVELSIYESIESAPDRVTIGAGVTSNAPTATEAMRQNAADMTKVIARIKALGIAEKDIQTTGVTLGAQYDYQNGGPVFRGYQASNRVSIKLGRVEETGRVLDALVEAGATDIGGPVFGIADDSALKIEARKRAIARGEAQARAYAGMLGYPDVKVLAVSETIEGTQPIYEAVKAVNRDASTAPVQPGQVSTGVSVTISYELVGAGAPGTK